MKGFDPFLYISRKIGFGAGPSFFLSALLPALLVMLISIVLVFSLTFITSMASSMEDVMVLLGCGHVLVDGVYGGDAAGIYSADQVRSAEALAFSGSSSGAVYLKGVDFATYFNPERIGALRLTGTVTSDVLNPVYMSSSLSEELGVEEGDRFSILVHDDSLGRTRPLLLTCSGIFSSGFDEFDSTLCYVQSGLLTGSTSTEIILDDPDSLDSFLSGISLEYDARSYKEVYSALYGNVLFSLSILYGVFFILAVLAAVFSSNIAFDYVARDRKDIASLMVMGVGEREIRRIYLSITLFFVVIALAFGFILGTVCSLFIPNMMDYLNSLDLDALGAYMTSFSLHIPFLKISLMLSGLFLSSVLSLLFSLRKTVGSDIMDIISSC